MKIITANIGRTRMSPERVRLDFKKIKKQFGVKFIGFQEIDEADAANEHKILREVFNRHKFVGFRRAVPIVVPKRASILKQEIVKACDGIDGVTPTRFLVVSAIQYRGKRFVLINTHYPAFAWNGKNESFQRAVMNAWQEQFDAHKKIVKKYHDLGYTVFWCGDVNRKDMPKVHPNERQLVTAGIDSISVVEGEYRVRVKKRGSFPLYSDHDARWVSFDLVR